MTTTIKQVRRLRADSPHFLCRRRSPGRAVMIQEPTFSGCVICCRPIGLFRMRDRGQDDAKILAVPTHDPLHGDYHDIGDIPRHFLQEVSHFFQVYKELEGDRVEVVGWEGAEAARQEIETAQCLYEAERFPGYQP